MLFRSSYPCLPENFKIVVGAFPVLVPQVLPPNGVMQEKSENKVLQHYLNWFSTFSVFCDIFWLSVILIAF